MCTRLAFGKNTAEVRLACIVVGFAFCVFFVDHVEDQLCGNNFAAYSHHIDDMIALMNIETKWLINKKITAIDQFLIKIQRCFCRGNNN